MPRWSEVAASAPPFAAAVQAVFDAHVHKTLATLRADGSPRLSGIEASFNDGEVWFGAMWESRKALDLRRDPRFELHSGSVDPPEWAADARIAGRAEEIDDPERKAATTGAGDGGAAGPFHLFRVEVVEVVHVHLGDPADHLVMEVWRPGQELRRIERR
ncbi:MAG: pyridoxamine 5'-phosphate oxidase family protein [Actinomycetota bacterium]|nr:pyridoxamine 5'-phosphate oxidase family protein [Actinomycetota bacterium]